MKDQIKDAVEFITEKTADNFFGSKTITITYHAGKIKRTEKTISEKTQAE